MPCGDAHGQGSVFHRKRFSGFDRVKGLTTDGGLVYFWDLNCLVV